MRGRWFSPRDLRFVNSINRELYDNVIQCLVTIYKVCASDTTVNVYGESSQETGLQFFSGVDVTALIDRADITTEYSEFGPDRDQTVVFKFRELALKQVNLFPEIGDIIKFNERMHSISNVVQEQFLGGIAEKSLSIIVSTNYTRISSLNIVERQF